VEQQTASKPAEGSPASPDGTLTIHEAAAITGWSARMLRYIEDSGLVTPARSASSYRLFGPAELQRLRTLRELLEGFEIELSEVGFALRLREDPALRGAVEAWLSAEAVQPAELSSSEWLAYEQDKHLRLLEAAGRPSFAPLPDEVAEPAPRADTPAITKENR
jgi:MerR family copper efflux transcriptional regulator